jgi:glycosyltransferase 2 family protein
LTKDIKEDAVTARRSDEVSTSRGRVLLPRHPRHPIRVALASVLLLLTALPVRPDHVSSLEADTFHVVNGLPDTLFWPMWAVMQFGNFLVVPIALLAALLTRRLRPTLDLAVAGPSAWLLAKVAKQAVVRGRPAELLNDVILRHAPAVGHGYLSGHAATAVAIATVLHPYVAPRWRWPMWVVASLVCVARVYVGAHLPLDVVGGAAMGWAIGALVHTLLGAPLIRRGRGPAGEVTRSS